MLGIRRRKQVEGWALDVNEDGRGRMSLSLRQRLAESNKLWLLCAAGFVVLVVVVLGQAKDTAKLSATQLIKNPKWPPQGAVPTPEHAAFAREFRTDKSVAGKVLEASFVNQRRFRVVVPAEISADDMNFIAKTAARKILHRFDHLCTVELYVRSAAGNRTYLAATTRWDPEKFGFVVKLHKLSPNLP